MTVSWAGHVLFAATGCLCCCTAWTVALDADFTLNLLRQLPQNSSTNVFFSPFGASLTLAIVHAGARGDTADEIRNVLVPSKRTNWRDYQASFRGISDMISGGGHKGVFDLVNLMVVRKGVLSKLLPAFTKLLKEEGVFGTQVEEMDEELENRTNSWVKRKTGGKIVRLLQKDDVDQSTVALLVNAIHFKGTWAQKFETRLTYEGIFHGTDGTETKVAFMFRRGVVNYTYNVDLDAHVVELPFEGDRARFIVVVPEESRDLVRVKRLLTGPMLNDILKRLFPVKVALSMPKFTISSRYDLVGPLNSLGVNEIFTEKADLSNVYGTKDIFVSKMLQVSKLKVDEEGAEAESATVVRVSGKSADEVITISMDHPFFFFITAGADNVILFAGEINKLKPV